MSAHNLPSPLPAPGRRTYLAAFLLPAAAVLLSLPFTWFQMDSPVRDEVGHIPLVQRWVKDPSIISVARFPEPKGVGLFAASAAWGRLFGASCPTLRTMIVLLALATFAAWVWLVRLWGLARPLAAGVALLVVPYFFIYTQMLYTEIPALLLTFLALACAEKLRRGGGWSWATGVALSAAMLIWVRQTLLVVPAALVVCSPWMAGRRRLRVALAAAAGGALGLVPMLLLWGGLVPPGEVGRFEGGGFYPDAFGFALAVLGGLGWPMLLAGRPRAATREPFFLLGGLALAAFLFFTLDLDYGRVDRMGLLQKALISLPLQPALPRAALFGSLLAGGLVLGRLAHRAVFPGFGGWVRVAAVLALLGLLPSLAGTPIFYDRYLILSLAMIFAIASQQAPRPAAWAFLAFFALVTVSHACYVTQNPRPSYLPVPLGRSMTTPANPLPANPATEAGHGPAR